MFGTKKYTRIKIWWNGWRDARKGYPANGAGQPSQYIKELIDACEYQLAEIAKKWSKEEKKLCAEYHKAFNRYEGGKNELDPAEKKLAKAEAAYENAEAKLDDLEHVSPQKGWYIVFCIFLILAEFPINYIVFDLFGEAKWLSMLMGVLICFSLPWAAHTTGMALKVGIKGNPVVISKVVATIVIVCGVLGGIAYIRQGFFNGNEIQEVLDIQLNDNVVITLFFLINGLAFLICMWTSYNAHPKDPKSFNDIIRKHKTARENTKKTLNLFLRAKSELEQASKVLDDIISKRKNGFEMAQNEALKIMKIWDNDIRYYCKVNIRHRKDRNEPACLNLKTAYSIPENLQGLKWDWDKEMITSKHGRPAADAEQPPVSETPETLRELKAVR